MTRVGKRKQKRSSTWRVLKRSCERPQSRVENSLGSGRAPVQAQWQQGARWLLAKHQPRLRPRRRRRHRISRGTRPHAEAFVLFLLTSILTGRLNLTSKPWPNWGGRKAAIH